MAIPKATPATITAGNTAEWLISATDYPAPDWQLTYVLVSATTLISFTSGQYEASTSHRISVSTTETEGWAPGRYDYKVFASDGASRYTVEEGTLNIDTNIAAAGSGYDARSFAKRCLDNIEAVIEGRASQAQLEYTIAGRQLKFIPPKELMDIRDLFRAEYRAEERARVAKKSSKNLFGQVQVVFS